MKKLGVYDDFVQNLIDSHPSTVDYRLGLLEKENAPHEEPHDLDANIDTSDFYQLMAENDGYDPLKTDDPNTSQNMPDLERELKTYSSLPPVSVQDSKAPLEWWKAHRKCLPILAELARNVLCIPAASASSERVFSASGNIVTDKRHNLSCETTKKLTLIKVNYEYVNNYIQVQTVNPEELEENQAPTQPTPTQPTPGNRSAGTGSYLKLRREQQKAKEAKEAKAKEAQASEAQTQSLEPTPGTSGTSGRQKAKKPEAKEGQKKKIKRALTYSSSTPPSDTTIDLDSPDQADQMEPPPAPAPAPPPKPKRVSRRISAASDSDTDSQSLINPPKRVRLSSSNLSASEILDELQKSPVKNKRKKVAESVDMFDDDDDDVADPTFKPRPK